MPSRHLTDVTLVSEDHDGPDDDNECDDPDYHDDHDECDEDHDDDEDGNGDGDRYCDEDEEEDELGSRRLTVAPL